MCVHDLIYYVYWSIVGTIMGKSINGHMTRVDRLWTRLPDGQFVHSAWNIYIQVFDYLTQPSYSCAIGPTAFLLILDDSYIRVGASWKWILKLLIHKTFVYLTKFTCNTPLKRTVSCCHLTALISWFYTSWVKYGLPRLRQNWRNKVEKGRSRK